MATETPTRTHCPTCGARIPRPDLSICSYCTTPLRLDAGAVPRDDATAKRLAKMRAHEDYAGAIAWDPPAGLEDRKAAARQTLGIFLGIAGLAAGAAAIGISLDRPLGLGLAIVGAAAIVAGIVLWSAGAKQRAQLRVMPLLKRPAIVTSRRSETVMQDGRTIYYFTLQFEDGSEGEFRFPGLGASHDPLVAGNLGVAYTRREALLGFRLIRV